MKSYISIPIPSEKNIEFNNFITEVFYAPSRNISILNSLGSFWQNYYSKYDLILDLNNNVVNLYTSLYYRLLNFIIKSNLPNFYLKDDALFDICVFKKSDTSLKVKNGETYLCIDLFKIINSNNKPYKDMNYLSVSFLDTTYTLYKDVHFFIDVENNSLEFSIDLFDEYLNISGGYYSNIGEDILVFLWAFRNKYQETYYLDRFNTFNISYLEDSEEAYNLINLLNYLSVNPKKIETIETAINSLLGVPFTLNEPEQVLDKSSSLEYTTIITNRKAYTLPPYVISPYNKGDIIPPFTSLGSLVKVSDFINDPTWVEYTPFPFDYACDRASIENLIRDLYNSIFYNNGDTPPDQQGVLTVLDKWQSITTTLNEVLPGRNWYFLETGVARKDTHNFYEYFLYLVVDIFFKYNFFKVTLEYYDAVNNNPEDVKKIIQNVLRTVLPVYLGFIIHFIRRYYFIDSYATLEDDDTKYHINLINSALIDFLNAQNYMDETKYIYSFLRFVDILSILEQDNFLYNGYYFYNGIGKYNNNINLSSDDNHILKLFLNFSMVDHLPSVEEYFTLNVQVSPIDPVESLNSVLISEYFYKGSFSHNGELSYGAGTSGSWNDVNTNISIN